MSQTVLYEGDLNPLAVCVKIGRIQWKNNNFNS
jgi:hypothetical protein